MASSLYECLRLYISPEYFYVHPELPDGNETLVFDRQNNSVSLRTDDHRLFIPNYCAERLIYGIVGILRLLDGPHLIVVSERKRVGEIDGCTIYMVQKTEVLPFRVSNRHLTDNQIRDNDSYVDMLFAVLKMDSFYFSPTYDLTHTMQRYLLSSPEFVSLGLLDRSDRRFVWNTFLLRDIEALTASKQSAHKFLMPIVNGFISINRCKINNKYFEWALLSRRSCYRAGTRFHSRGLDDQGNTSNYIETESILEYDGNKCSFVQIRGSIPLFWNQLPNLTRNPVPTVEEGYNQEQGYKQHMSEQDFRYGKVTIINLIDSKGREKSINDTFCNVATALKIPISNYVYFDFHKECKALQWDRLSILLDRIEEMRVQQAYFYIAPGSNLISKQVGVFRSNCIDCLDRTNVVQSLIARKTLTDQLRVLGVISKRATIEDHVVLEELFKNVWADNADVCALHYTGTRALKTDYTRTGKRTLSGAIQDGINAIYRFFQNNFYDGSKQDSLDLFLGNYEVNPDEGKLVPCPLRSGTGNSILVLPVVSLMSFAMMMVSMLLPSTDSNLRLGYMGAWGVALTVSLMAIYRNGRLYVDHPKLITRKDYSPSS